jgi:predicted outer membrane repeat protein
MRCLIAALLFSVLSLAAAIPCKPGINFYGVVDTKSAAALAAAVACEDGVAVANWTGNVLLKEPIIVGNGTRLIVLGISAADDATVDGDNSTQLFVVQGGAHLMLQTLTLQHGSFDGPAVVLQEQASLNASNVQFLQNSGGVVNAAAKGTVDMNNCEFTGNGDAGRPAFGGQPSDAVVLNDTDAATLVQTTFSANTGTAIWVVNDSALTIKDCIIRETHEGRAFLVQGVGALNAENVTFENNNSGCANDGNATFNNCAFDNTEYQPGTDVNISNTIFRNNVGSAAIEFRSDDTLNSETKVLRCSNCTFAANTGGAVVMGVSDATYIVANMTFEQSMFTNNTADSGAALLLNQNCTVIITDCDFASNYARYDGGAIAMIDIADNRTRRAVTISGSRFTDNAAVNRGGAIFNALAADIIWSNNQYSGNTAMRGGGLYLIGNNLTNTDCLFTDNTATRDGGAIAIADYNGTFTNCSFINNSAFRGGGIAWFGSSSAQEVAIINSSFIGCTAISGAALRILGSTAGSTSSTTSVTHISGTSFTNSVAESTGGAVMLEESNAIVVVNTSTFTNNSALSGGSLHCSAAVTMNISDSVCDHNSAAEGGCMIIYGNATLKNVSMRYNTADSAGGAITVLTNGTLHLGSNSVLAYNTAVEGGAISMQQHTIVTLKDSILHSNTAVQASAAIMQSGAVAFTQLPLLVNTTIANSTAGCCYAEGHGLTVTATDYCGSIDSGNDRQCCVTGEYADNGICRQCDKSSFTCTQLGIDTAAIPLVAGYWRESVGIEQHARAALH